MPRSETPGLAAACAAFHKISLLDGVFVEMLSECTFSRLPLALFRDLQPITVSGQVLLTDRRVNS